jgi:hypothetical protein
MFITWLLHSNIDRVEATLTISLNWSPWIVMIISRNVAFYVKFPVKKSSFSRCLLTWLGVESALLRVNLVAQIKPGGDLEIFLDHVCPCQVHRWLDHYNYIWLECISNDTLLAFDAGDSTIISCYMQCHHKSSR